MFGDFIRDKTSNKDFFNAYDHSFQTLIRIATGLHTDGNTNEEQVKTTVLAGWSMLHGYASFLIDNKRDHVVGSKKQIDLILQKLLRL